MISAEAKGSFVIDPMQSVQIKVMKKCHGTGQKRELSHTERQPACLSTFTPDQKPSAMRNEPRGDKMREKDEEQDMAAFCYQWCQAVHKIIFIETATQV